MQRHSSPSPLRARSAANHNCTAGDILGPTAGPAPTTQLPGHCSATMESPLASAAVMPMPRGLLSPAMQLTPVSEYALAVASLSLTPYHGGAAGVDAWQGLMVQGQGTGSGLDFGSPLGGTLSGSESESCCTSTATNPVLDSADRVSESIDEVIVIPQTLQLSPAGSRSLAPSERLPASEQMLLPSPSTGSPSPTAPERLLSNPPVAVTAPSSQELTVAAQSTSQLANVRTLAATLDPRKGSPSGNGCSDSELLAVAKHKTAAEADSSSSEGESASPTRQVLHGRARRALQSRNTPYTIGCGQHPTPPPPTPLDRNEPTIMRADILHMASPTISRMPFIYLDSLANIMKVLRDKDSNTPEGRYELFSGRASVVAFIAKSWKSPSTYDLLLKQNIGIF